MLERVLQRPKFQVRCLGAFKVVETQLGRNLTPTGRKARALIAYLCLTKEPVTRERLATLLWGDRGDEQARASLRQTLHEVRSLPGGDRLLQSERDAVAIRGDISTDFAAIKAAAQSGDLEGLAEALLAWRGELFEDLSTVDSEFDSWLTAERLRMVENLAAAASEAARAGMARGELARARKVVNLIQHRDSTNEGVLRLGLTLDSLCGDSAGLRRRYERFRALLRSELDTVPSGETQRLFRELAPTGPGDAPHIPIEPGNVPSSTSDESAPCPPESISVAPEAGDAPLPTHRAGRGIRIAAVAATVLVLAAFALAVWRPFQTSPPPQPLLAVLPFENLSGDARTRYFSDGMTEEIVDALLRTTDIRVAAPASSFRLRKAGFSEAATALAATQVLSGSLQRHGNRVHVVAQLTDSRGDGIWSGTYDRTIAEAPALQHDLATQIADALDMRLSPAALAEAQKVDPVAYDHYLRGRDLFIRRDWDGALPELEKSVRLAPRFAKAWSTLGEARFLYASYELSGNDYDPAAQRDALSAVKRALALDPNDGEALAVQAMLTSIGQLPEIDRLFARALRAEPNNTQILNWYAIFLSRLGRRHEALYEIRRAYELDRLTPSIAENLANMLLEEGEYGESSKIYASNRENGNPVDYFALGADFTLLKHDWRGLADYLSVLPADLWPSQERYYRLVRETAIALAAGNRGKFAELGARWRREGLTDDVGEVSEFLVALGDPDGALRLVELNVTREKSIKLMAASGWSALFTPNLSLLLRNPRTPALLARWASLITGARPAIGRTSATSPARHSIARRRRPNSAGGSPEIRSPAGIRIGGDLTSLAAN